MIAPTMTRRRTDRWSSRGGTDTPSPPRPTLDGSAYLDPATFDREIERVFGRSWLCAGREEQLREPGDFLTIAVGAENILVLRDRSGGVRAFHNLCRHRGARLCDGQSGRIKGSIVCPYHAWTYALDGRLVGTPHLQGGPPADREQRGLLPVACDTWGGFVFVNPAGTAAPPLAATLGEIPGRLARYPLADLRIRERQIHEVPANWKILAENFMECYHCPGVHPELCDLVPIYRDGIVDVQGGDVVAEFRPGAASFTLTGRTDRPPFPGLSDAEKRRYVGELIAPGVMLNLVPDFVYYRTLWPLAPGLTRIVSEWLFHPEAIDRPGFDPADAVEFAMLVARQDWEVCAGIQKGAGSRAFRGGLYVDQEAEAARFLSWYRDRMRD
jgi:Rieske 2Fe-2S family protein